jgi:GDP-mannose 6-dehydrogenase
MRIGEDPPHDPEELMRISIFGLGYVGAVSAACLARDGHMVIGVDVNQVKVDGINAGMSPIIEPGLADALGQGVVSGRIGATTDAADAVRRTDVSFVCVGTPSLDSGALDLRYVRRVCEQIGEAIAKKADRHTVVLRSTMLPGSTETEAIPILEKHSGKHADVDFGVCFNPEFLREGTAVADFYDPPRTVIGEREPLSGDIVAAIYSALQAPLVRSDIRTAEMVKYCDNTFHALKIAYANEIGALCKRMGVDSHKVIEIFVLDTKLNLSPVYLKPGYAFGGSCLPKDLRALIQRGRELDVDIPLHNAIVESNERQKRVALQMIRRAGSKKIGLLGLSFKHDTDDLRESPAVELVETLVGKGYDVAVFDPNVTLSTLVGSNKAYVERELPHLSKLMRSSVDEVLSHADTVVITNNDRSFAGIYSRLNTKQNLIDLVRIEKDLSQFDGRYEGIGW